MILMFECPMIYCKSFDFKLSEVLENDTKEKVALTEEQEQALLSFIKTDNVYHKYYDDVLILLKTGLLISELCGLTIKRVFPYTIVLYGDIE